MPSASNNNQSNTKLVKQTSVNSVNSGGACGSSAGSKANNKKTENSTKSNNATIVINETSSIKSAKENTNNVVAAAAQQQNSKSWETASAAGNANPSTLSKDAGNDALNPMKLTFTTIEHKIRNLEKRKTKLEGYRAIQASGKELSGDQRTAVAKYDAVLATLDFARDLVKQMQQFTKDAEKEQKKQARKELIAKAQAETIKIREVLIIQNILSCFTDEAVRTDFLGGENGAAKLETNEFEILEKFCLDVQTRRPETAEDLPFATTAQKAAEVFSMTIDARPKQYGDSTYENVKRIFHRIQESDYLDKIFLTDVPEPEPETKTIEDEREEDVVENNIEEVEVDGEMISQENEMTSLEEGMEKINIETGITQQPAVNEVPVDNGLMQQQQQMTQAFIKDSLEMQQQVALVNMTATPTGQPLMNAPMALPVAAVPSFQPATQGHSVATTPVHVAMYHPAGAAIHADVPRQIVGQMIASLPTQHGVQNAQPSGQVAQQQQQQQQQRQMLSSPTGQPGIGATTMTMQQQQLPPQGHFNPTPVHAVEQNFYKHPSHPPQQPQQQQQQQYMQQMRPLADVIGSGNFYFLQDSELDSPDLNNQGQGGPQHTLVFEQQQQPPPPQQQPQQNLMNDQNPNAGGGLTQSLPNQHQQQLQQAQQQIPPQQQQQHNPQQQQVAQTPIQTQTFTNQSFPQMPPPAQSTQAGLMNSNSSSPLFQQQHQQQQQQQPPPPATPQTNNTNQQLFSPPVQNQNIQTQQSQLILAANETQQQQPPPLMMMNRMPGANQPPTTTLMQQQQQVLLQQQQQLTPQTQNLVGVMQQLPNPSAGDLNQSPKNVGFQFEAPVMASLNYEQQMQSQLTNASNVLKNSLAAADEPKTTQIIKNDLIIEWGDEAVLKTPTAGKFTASSSSSNVQVESNKWSAEVNANSPITVQQTQTRKNEWTSSTTNVTEPAAGYGNDNRTESNHWHSQDSGGYSRGGAGNRGQGGGGGNTGGYQRRSNDDRRDDRRPAGGTGGAGGGGYRGRSNYGSGNPQQNGQTRGGGGGSGGIYFRNNENTNTNSYYQNGSGGGGGTSGNVYSNKDNGGGSRYDSRGGGGGGYRGPRGTDNPTNPRSNGPPRHMTNRSGGGGGGGGSGGNANATNTNSNSYMNSRQSSNRIPLGLENKN